MGFIELLLIAVSLSMDTFAVSMCQGLKMPKIHYGQAAVIALLFGVFQGTMPFIGWALGKQFETYITGIDHWIAFVLLAIIGGKMIWEACHHNSATDCPSAAAFNLKEVVVLAIATSIDALAIGITFAFLTVSIVPAVLLIGTVTFVLSLIGVLIGNIFGDKFKNKAEIAGGAVLILIGCKILLEHLGVF